MNDRTPNMVSPRGEATVHAPNAALMIDFDNVTLGIRTDLQHQLRALMNSEIIKGKVAVQRAYADWRRYPQYIVPLSEASIDLIFAPAFGSNKKNATDIRLAIDALELVFTRPEIGVFILLSGDSDFSSLVLKLKEYGKYVIGVGIRESSSDLLIQNCDEYYSYNELTGFTKEGDVEHVSMDPWQLVVLAVTQMKKENDVMRSDRLKQVMQSLDPTFDEKDVGFNRFSKFVVEAQNRGMITLAKLENGQFAVDIGGDANVSPEDEEAFKQLADRSGGRSKRRPRSKGPAKRSSLLLAEAFDLLREALVQLGATVEASVDAEAVRERMLDLFSGDNDPLFERPRFQRLMRQANDADVIELVKQDDAYVMRLGSATQAPTEEVKKDEDAGKATKRPRTTTKKTTKAKSTRAETTRKKATRSRTKVTDDDAPTGQAELTAAPVTPDESTERRGTGRRHGSRRAVPRRKPSTTQEAEQSPNTGKKDQPAATDPVAPRPSTGSRSLGPRRGSSRGSRGMKAPPKQQEPGSTESVAEPVGKAASPKPVPAPKPAPAPKSKPADKQRVRSAPRSQPAGETAPPDENGGLLKRMSAAIQKVMRGPEDE